MTTVIKPEDTLETAMEKINQEIDSRRTYGIRREELPTTRKVTRCMWSNASAAWVCGLPETRRVCPTASEELKHELAEIQDKRYTCWYPKTESEWRTFSEESERVSEKFRREKPKCREVVSKVQCLDANEIAIVGMEREKIKELAPLFAKLPLYSGSFEARTRGVFTLKGVEIPPGIAKQPLDELDRETIRALVEKTREIREE